MKQPIPLPRDREMLSLLLSGSAVLIGLFWMFFGNQALTLILPRHIQPVFYYFFSGVIFAFSFIGLYGFIRTILSFTEFMVEKDNLHALLYDNLLNDEHEGLFLKNTRGIYKVISPYAKTVLNLSNKRVIGLGDLELHKPATANRILHEDQRVLEYGETIEWETTQQTKLGLETFLCRKFPCRDPRGKIVGIIGVCKNITILKTFQNLNQQLEGRYQNLFNTLPYPALVLDPVNMQPYTFNDAMCRLLGYDRNEFSRMRMSLHVQPDDLPAFQQSISNMLVNGGGDFETSLITRQRDAVSISGHTQLVFIEGKAYLHMLLYDSTESKRSTQVLISSELKYRSLFEHANDAIIIVSPKTLNIIDANEIAVQTLGYSRDDLLLLTIQELDTSSDHSYTQNKIADLEIYNHALYEHEIKTRQGQLIPVEINAHKLNYGDDDVYQFVIRNIVTRKQTEAALIASEQRYRQMFESNMAIKLVIDPERFCIEDANPAAAAFYGYPLDELKGMDLARINILSRDKLNSLIQQTREQNLGFYSCPHRLASGEIRFVEVRDGPMEINGRQLFYSIIYDVTASKQAENQVLVASKMFDYSTDAVMLINDANQVVSVNHAFSKITGYQQSEIINHNPEIILASRNDKLIDEKVQDALSATGQWKGEIWHRLKSGQSRPLHITINSIDSDNSSHSYVVMLSLKQSRLDIENQTQYVELTELPNKPLFIDRLQNAIERARRNRVRLGVILIDFRNFSDINKRYGYDLGDKILVAISKRLKYNTRSTDTISHFSSDDFAILIEDLHDIQQMGIVLNKLISTLSETYQTTDHALKLDVSMGVSIYPEDGDSSEMLIDQADSALSNAQQFKGSHFELTNENMNKLANLWLDTEARMHVALRNNEFILQYLPLIDIQTNEITGIEALLRWNHPDKGYLLPRDFLTTAEQSGFIGAIGIYTLEMSLNQFRQWLDRGLKIKRLNINISQSQIDIDLLDILIEKCRKYQIPHESIGLEFSEVNFALSTDQQKMIFRRFSEHKFYIVIDDFGLSTNSIGCLLQCNINAIKLHPSLMAGSQHSADQRTLLDGIVSLCRTLDIDIIAEGIETQNECEYLQSLSITTMQGHFFSKPLYVSEVSDFILQHSPQ